MSRQRDVARKLRSNQTEPEKHLWMRLRYRQLDGCRFRRQVPIGSYIVDFVCPSHRLIIEVDGGQHSEAGAADAIRTQWLEGRGYQVLRFWNNDVLSNADGVIGAILRALRARDHPPPQPSPARGEGATNRD